MQSQWASAVQAIASLAAVANLIFLFYQLRIMRGQLSMAQQNILAQQRELSKQTMASMRSAQGANVFAMMNYLEEPRHLEARAQIQDLKDKPLSEWTREDRAAADLAARMWEQAAALQKMQLLPTRFIHYQYGGAVVRAWNVLAPYIEELREKSDRAQRATFEELAAEVRESGWFGDDKDRRPLDTYPSMLADVATDELSSPPRGI